MTVNARGNCQHGSIVKQSVGILSRNLSISLNTMKWKMFCNFENFFFVFFFYNFDNNYNSERSWCDILIGKHRLLLIDIVTR